MSFVFYSMLIVVSFSSSEAVQYFLDPTGAQSCESLCQQHGQICAGTGHGFSPVSALPIYHRLGITCGPGNGSERYKSRDNPAYIRLELETFDRCLGFRGIPNDIDCAARSGENIRRICPCIRGEFTLIQNVPTLEGCTSVEHFTIDDKLYLAFSRLRAYRRYQSGTQIFRLEDNTFVLHQTLKTTYSGPEKTNYFQINGEHFVAIPYSSASQFSRIPPKTVIFQWSKRGYFESFQELQGGVALSTTFVEIDGAKFIVINGYGSLYVYTWRRNGFRTLQTLSVQRAYITECTPFQPRNGTYLACAVWGNRKKSLVFKWSGKGFVLHQKIAGVQYAVTVETTALQDATPILILAQRQKGLGTNMFNVETPIYSWNTDTAFFEHRDSLSVATRGASACRPFRIGNDIYLVVSQSADKKSIIYKYRSGRFVLYQELRAAFADDATFFTFKRTHYIALATRNMRSSPVFMLN